MKFKVTNEDIEDMKIQFDADPEEYGGPGFCGALFDAIDERNRAVARLNIIPNKASLIRIY